MGKVFFHLELPFYGGTSSCHSVQLCCGLLNMYLEMTLKHTSLLWWVWLFPLLSWVRLVITDTLVPGVYT